MRIDVTVKTTKRNAPHYMIIIYNISLQVPTYIYTNIPIYTYRRRRCSKKKGKELIEMLYTYYYTA